MRLLKSFVLSFAIIGVFAAFAFMTERTNAEDSAPAQPAVKEIAAQPMDPVESVIERQIAAIKSRDAEAAFENATSAFKNKHGSAEDFLNEMRFEYRPLYNAKNYEFLRRSENGNTVIQKIKIHARYGDPVTVIYRLKSLDNGTLLIDSFALLNQTDAQPI